MVNKLTSDMSLTNNGLRDWLVQRFSSIIIGIYFIVLCIFFLAHAEINYSVLRSFFATTWMQIFTLLAFFSLFLHAWVGVITVITDYIKPVSLRIALQVIVILALAVYFFWCMAILWKLA